MSFSVFKSEKLNLYNIFFSLFSKSSLITTSSDKQVVLIDEYNPLRPNEYSDFKQRAREREERERREKREREERNEDRRDRRFVLRLKVLDIFFLLRVESFLFFTGQRYYLIFNIDFI